MSVSQTLIKAKALVQNPEHWTKGAAARSVNAAIEDPDSEHAVCWCSLGAIWKVGGLAAPADSDGFKAEVAMCAAVRDVGFKGVVDFNDRPERKHEEVLAMFDKAIAAAKEQENEAIRTA